jgi:hypothetical protein
MGAAMHEPRAYHAHGNNLYKYGGQAQKIWYFKITKVPINKSI